MKFQSSKNNHDDFDISSNWILTYSDMVTIILIFFIIFFVTSASENSVLYEVKQQLNDKVGVLQSEKSKLEGDYENLSQENEKLQEQNITLAQELFQLKNIEEDIDTSDEDFIEYLRENELLDDVYLIQNDDGLLIRFKDSVLFDSGQANLTGEGNTMLDKIADKIMDIDNKIRVEGFTDNKPINTEKFPSNWELSADRAIRVMRYFIENKGMDASRFSFTGWGEYKPIASNDTEEGRLKNRRIEITILK